MELTVNQALKRAVQYHRANKFQEAENLYKAIINIQPLHPDANHNLGVLTLNGSKPEESLPFFKIALQENTNNKQYWLSYIDALIKANQLERAKSVLNQGKQTGLAGFEISNLEANIAILDSNSQGRRHPKNRLMGAINYREEGRYQKALGWLNNYLSLEPNDAEAWSLLAHVLILDNKDGAAEKVLSTAVAINPNLPSIYRNEARLLLKKSKPEEALLKAQSGYDLSSDDPESWLVLAACLGGCQRDLEALPLIERTLNARPNYAEAYANRAIIRLRENNITGAIIDLEASVFHKPHLTQMWGLLGAVYHQNKNLEKAIQALKKVAELEPNNANNVITLGEFLRQSNEVTEAIAILKLAIDLAPENARAWANLGTALQQADKIEDAKFAYEKASAIDPKSAEILSNLGLIEKDSGDFESAVQYFNQAILIKPNLAEAHNNLGTTLQELGRFEGAIASYAQAIQINPEFAEAYNNLGITLKKLNRLEEALVTTIKSIKIKPTSTAKNLFIDLTKNIGVQKWDQSLVQLVIIALLEPWGRPSDVTTFACRLLKTDKEFVQLVNQLKDSDSQANYNKSLLSIICEREFATTPLLSAMLTSSPIPDTEIEFFLTTLRCNLLKVTLSNIGQGDVIEDVATLHCSLAQQCFINEYVYFQTPDEIERSHQLLDLLTKSLEEEHIPSAILVITVACYFPLYTVAGSEKLLHQEWSDGIRIVLKQQIQEPLEELALLASIGPITRIDNQISLAVQSQYEESPYPRWVRLQKDSSKKFLNYSLQSKFPLSQFKRLDDDRNPKILIAGCGTGQHPIGTSQIVQGAKVLAIDLSMSSLAYAKRKTIELGIKEIEYAQADILKLESIGQTFDVIESSGVLHHLENPFMGWEVLLSVLRPYGLMKLGLYSELARRDIVKVRKLIRSEGIGSSSREIRDYRKYLLDLMESDDFGFATSSSDFFSTSACRDLLFHVQEQRMNLPVLAKFLKKHDLNFLGFEIDSTVKHSYKSYFPDDPSATNLDNWHMYEEENPNIFRGMYQFWCQKIG